MEHDVVKQWFNEEFQSKLKYLITEIAFNAFGYGGADYCNFQIYQDKIILKDNGLKFDLSKDEPQTESTGYNLGKILFDEFFSDYKYMTKYEHTFDEENKTNIVTINIITDFNIFVESNCEVVTKGNFHPIDRRTYKESIFVDVPPECTTFIYNSSHLFASGEATLIGFILSKLPSEGTLIVKHNENYTNNKHIQEIFKEEKRLKFETVNTEDIQ